MLLSRSRYPNPESADLTTCSPIGTVSVRNVTEVEPEDRSRPRLLQSSKLTKLFLYLTTTSPSPGPPSVASTFLSEANHLCTTALFRSVVASVFGRQHRHQQFVLTSRSVVLLSPVPMFYVLISKFAIPTKGSSTFYIPWGFDFGFGCDGINCSSKTNSSGCKEEITLQIAIDRARLYEKVGELYGTKL